MTCIAVSPSRPGHVLDGNPLVGQVRRHRLDRGHGTPPGLARPPALRCMLPVPASIIVRESARPGRNTDDGEPVHDGPAGQQLLGEVVALLRQVDRRRPAVGGPDHPVRAAGADLLLDSLELTALAAGSGLPTATAWTWPPSWPGSTSTSSSGSRWATVAHVEAARTDRAGRAGRAGGRVGWGGRGGRGGGRPVSRFLFVTLPAGRARQPARGGAPGAATSAGHDVAWSRFGGRLRPWLGPDAMVYPTGMRLFRGQADTGLAAGEIPLGRFHRPVHAVHAARG